MCDADAATAKTQQDARQIKVTQVRSGIGGTRRQRETLKSLGLRRIRQSVVREDNPSVRGMIARVAHLVTVEEA
ncbi:50S ribosomal protein L30 [Actinomyces ruminis]|uniref:50S ribosomal protein L30 n=1 Tax=Actinomyces ruminis TaxID=1937003 RepID=UPI000B6AB39E|nr:50S ribosomal protein L30 [Actinomyces ruminis]